MLDAHVVLHQGHVPEHLPALLALEGAISRMHSGMRGQRLLASKTYSTVLADKWFLWICYWISAKI